MKWRNNRGTPCWDDGRDCPDRSPDCHTKCERYLAFRAQIKPRPKPDEAQEVMIRGMIRDKERRRRKRF